MTTAAVVRFYLVRDGDGRVCWLAAVTGEGWSQRVYGWVPDLDAFVANDPLTLDCQIDRELSYEPLTAEQAADVVEAGLIGRLADDEGLHDLLRVMSAEPRRLDRGVLSGPGCVR
ncbi:hypothetical protein FZI85_30020 [Mycobacterium sp. CBMA293]|uniref:hypothetical protein n=1 Tax=unclassified Mycolicibacterium TaxID=2636767 RepID=UPI0012DD13EE|nr:MULTISPECIES: hypothetical protein [unclassified Mycolicibacterium]QGT51744.1 hypothetical protein pCBMA213_3_00002 [Mycolicibacterium sp.]MUL50074.1 hypothetical protein [Mycolicibacterium sp. CBMA 360]MUL62726.1 hypothetical protein [Mycolicibacterium sp. CBMA 335]MUL69629.1 hypothetical protein [Mycolicibacterium sp. CBMA 311]MUL97415.1 hypothetical protein [Mycolicibacterium sp. CBMA 230]